MGTGELSTISVFRIRVLVGNVVGADTISAVVECSLMKVEEAWNPGSVLCLSPFPVV